MESRAMRTEEEIEQAMRRHGSAVYVVALAQTRSREDAQDVAQDVFVSLLICGKSFRDDDHLRAWLLRATVNRCADVYRSPWKRKVQAMPEGDPISVAWKRVPRMRPCGSLKEPRYGGH